jgi:hypothetical protein
MTKTSLPRALLLAGIVAAAGVAQAESFDVPQQAGEASTMTHGAPNLLTTNSPYGSGHVIVDTTTLGAAPATVTTYTYTYPVTTYSYVQPPVAYVAPPVAYANPDVDTVVTRVYRPEVVSRTASAATFNVPSRAGEASTMTGGAPNMVTDNWRVISQTDHPVVIVN